MGRPVTVGVPAPTHWREVGFLRAGRSHLYALECAPWVPRTPRCLHRAAMPRRLPLLRLSLSFFLI